MKITLHKTNTASVGWKVVYRCTNDHDQRSRAAYLNPQPNCQQLTKDLTSAPASLADTERIFGTDGICLSGE